MTYLVIAQIDCLELEVVSETYSVFLAYFQIHHIYNTTCTPKEEKNITVYILHNIDLIIFLSINGIVTIKKCIPILRMCLLKYLRTK